MGFSPEQPEESDLLILERQTSMAKAVSRREYAAWREWASSGGSTGSGREEVHAQVGVPHAKVFFGQVAGLCCLEDPQRRGI